jgi:hypothetical protein
MLEWPSFPHPPPYLRSKQQYHGCGNGRRRGCVVRSGWILATGLASQTPSAESAPTTGIVRRYLHRLNVRPWAVVLLLMLFSLVCLPIFEVEANRETGTYYGDRIFGSLAVQLRTSTWLPALLALGFATGFIHYLLDRSVYRMSDPQVRAAASGLIGNLARRSRRKNVSSLALVLVLAFCLCLFAARADWKSGGGTTASEDDLHAETCLPT